jgi:hypothetical protein
MEKRSWKRQHDAEPTTLCTRQTSSRLQRARIAAVS